MPFDWTLNPYRGCTHGCHYCFARRYHAQFEMDSGDEFASVILVKQNIVGVLARELDRAVVEARAASRSAPPPIRISRSKGTTSSRAALIEALTRGRTPFGLITKGPMVVRDIDVLLEHARAARNTVYMSVPTVDEDAWQQLEPGTAHPLQRLRAVRALVDAGVNAGVLMAPIVPGFSTARHKLERTIKAIADHGARFVGCNVMYLQDGTRDHFMRFIERDFPAMRPRFERLYAKKYPPDAYRKEVQAMVRVLQERYGLRKRKEADAEHSSAAASARKRTGRLRVLARSPSTATRRLRTRAPGPPTQPSRFPARRRARRPSPSRRSATRPSTAR